MTPAQLRELRESRVAVENGSDWLADAAAVIADNIDDLDALHSDLQDRVDGATLTQAELSLLLVPLGYVLVSHHQARLQAQLAGTPAPELN